MKNRKASITGKIFDNSFDIDNLKQ